MLSPHRQFRFAVRAVLRTPGQSILAVVALGLGIGVTSTAFSVVYGTVIKGLPFDRSERLMVLDRRALAGAGERADGLPNRVHQLADWSRRQRSFEALAAFATTGVNLSSAGSVPERLAGAYLSPNTFDLLRVRPQLGRGFESSDARAGAPQVVVVGHSVWQGRFGGASDIVGRTVQLNGALTTIVGVMPREFGFPLNQSIWLPLDIDPLQAPRGQGRVLTVFGRLTDEASIESARTEFEVLTRDLAANAPADYGSTTVLIRPYWRRFLGPDAAVPGLYAMLVAVFGVLLVACANVANLLLARAIVRTRELALRVALGASRAQVAAQVLAEAGVVAAAGGIFGLGLAWIGIDAFRRVAVDTNPPFWMEFALSGPVVAFVVAMVVISALASGIVPALRSSRPNLNEVLNDAPRAGSSLGLGRAGRVLVTAQLALSIALLLPSSTMVKSILQLQAHEYGFAVDDVLTGLVTLPAADYPDAQRQLAFYDQLERQLAAGGGVRSAALASALPGQPGSWVSLEIEGRSASHDRDRPAAQETAVSAGSFQTYGVRVLEGREFRASDVASTQPVAIVNRRFIERYFSDRRAIGQRIRLVDPGLPVQPWRVIVGVVPDTPVGRRNENRDWGVYVPLAQAPARGINLIVRAAGDPRQLAPWIRRTVASLDSGMPVGAVFTMREVIFRTVWSTFLFGSLFASFGVVSLILSVVGLYGVVAFSTNCRAHEIGVRVALGAAPARIVRLILRQGAWQLGIGAVVGTAGGYALSSVFVRVEPGIQVFDPQPHAIVLGILAAVTLVAYLVPAMRATRHEPASVLSSLR
jgi:predicted permease